MVKIHKKERKKIGEVTYVSGLEQSIEHQSWVWESIGRLRTLVLDGTGVWHAGFSYVRAIDIIVATIGRPELITQVCCWWMGNSVIEDVDDLIVE